MIIYNFEKKDKQKQEEPAVEPEKEYDYQYEPKTSPLDELVYWGQIGAGVGLVVATLAEDVFSGGAGVADDAASFSIAYELIFGW